MGSKKSRKRKRIIPLADRKPRGSKKSLPQIAGEARTAQPPQAEEADCQRAPQETAQRQKPNPTKRSRPDVVVDDDDDVVCVQPKRAKQKPSPASMCDDYDRNDTYEGKQQREGAKEEEKELPGYAQTTATDGVVPTTDGAPKEITLVVDNNDTEAALEDQEHPVQQTAATPAGEAGKQAGSGAQGTIRTAAHQQKLLEIAERYKAQQHAANEECEEQEQEDTHDTVERAAPLTGTKSEIVCQMVNNLRIHKHPLVLCAVSGKAGCGTCKKEIPTDSWLPHCAKCQVQYCCACVLYKVHKVDMTTKLRKQLTLRDKSIKRLGEKLEQTTAELLAVRGALTDSNLQHAGGYCAQLTGAFPSAKKIELKYHNLVRNKRERLLNHWIGECTSRGDGPAASLPCLEALGRLVSLCYQSVQEQLVKIGEDLCRPLHASAPKILAATTTTSTTVDLTVTPPPSQNSDTNTLPPLTPVPEGVLHELRIYLRYVFKEKTSTAPPFLSDKLAEKALDALHPLPMRATQWKRQRKESLRFALDAVTSCWLIILSPESLRLDITASRGTVFQDERHRISPQSTSKGHSMCLIRFFAHPVLYQNSVVRVQAEVVIDDSDEKTK